MDGSFKKKGKWLFSPEVPVYFVTKELCIERNDLSEIDWWTAEIRWLPQHHDRCLVNTEAICFVKFRLIFQGRNCTQREAWSGVSPLEAVVNQHWFSSFQIIPFLQSSPSHIKGNLLKTSPSWKTILFIKWNKKQFSCVVFPSSCLCVIHKPWPFYKHKPHKHVEWAAFHGLELKYNSTLKNGFCI